jgi:hypothetical protein
MQNRHKAAMVCSTGTQSGCCYVRVEWLSPSGLVGWQAAKDEAGANSIDGDGLG